MLVLAVVAAKAELGRALGKLGNLAVEFNFITAKIINLGLH